MKANSKSTMITTLRSVLAPLEKHFGEPVLLKMEVVVLETYSEVTFYILRKNGPGLLGEVSGDTDTHALDEMVKRYDLNKYI